MPKAANGSNFRPHRKGIHVKRDGGSIDYSAYATEQWAILIAFFRAYPDILEDICTGDRCEYPQSLMGRVTKRYMARYRETFTFASRGYGKTTDVVSDKCNKGILWPGEITGYYAPVETQAAPLASKAFSSYERNYPILAAHWDRNHDTQNQFRISTINGSKFIMDIDRGVDTSGVVAEECAQEDKNPFNWSEFNQIVLGTNRLQYAVDGVPNPKHLDSQIHYITSCTRKENESYTVCEKIREEMRKGESAFALWIPWEVVVLCRMKPYSYYSMLRKKLTADEFDRECNSLCTGNVENPIVKDSALQASRTLTVMEDQHCGRDDCFYILGYDVSSRDVSGNALCANSVLKCRVKGESAAEGLLKDLVYVMDFRPPATARQQAVIIKRRWWDYAKDAKGKNTYLVIDARQYGQAVIEQLHTDLGDGLPPLATVTHEYPYSQMEQEGAVACIYPLQATGNSGRDPNSVMLDYIEREYENGNLRMLTSDLVQGVTSYKLSHGITDDDYDSRIQIPYLATNRLCGQIKNLRKKYGVNGWTEQEISKRIQKDMWSATLYACRMAQKIEHEELLIANGRKNAWEQEAQNPTEHYGSYNAIPRRQIKRLGRLAIGRG